MGASGNITGILRTLLDLSLRRNHAAWKCAFHDIREARRRQVSALAVTPLDLAHSRIPTSPYEFHRCHYHRPWSSSSFRQPSSVSSTSAFSECGTLRERRQRGTARRSVEAYRVLCREQSYRATSKLNSKSYNAACLMHPPG